MTHRLIPGEVNRRHPIQAVEGEARHLHEVERLGESAETPLIALLGLVLFFAGVFVVMTGIAFAAYYLAL
jgi:trehalose utilization protein